MYADGKSYYLWYSFKGVDEKNRPRKCFMLGARFDARDRLIFFEKVQPIVLDKFPDLRETRRGANISALWLG